MSDLRQAAQLALEFVTSEAWGKTPYMDVCVYEDAARLRDALRAALAQEQEPVQEPYCYVYEYDSPLGMHRTLYPKAHNGKQPDRAIPLYTTPPQRPPLTDEEMRKLWSQYGYKSALCMRFARAIERKVRGEA